ncbi:MAG: sugar phosphate isomerase/epimerase family protein [Chitinophagaceae bacterium]
MQNRRIFLKNGLAAIGGTLLLPQIPKDVLAAAHARHIQLGFQTFPIRQQMASDFKGTLSSLAKLGYQQVEMCSPAGYAGIGYGFLKDTSTSELKSMIKDCGLNCPSSHFTSAEFTPEKIDKSIEWAKGMELELMVLSTFWLPKTATLDDYRAAADKLNTAAEKIRKAGMQAVFHNHDFEFHEIEGKLIYNELLGRLDPKLVKLQFQTQVITLGYKAQDYFNAHPGRFISSHLSDWTNDKKEVPIGQGVIEWEAFFKSAQRGGVQYAFVEMSQLNMENSAKFLVNK